jgi:exodeoxyribonuclease VII small subunit
MSPRGKKIAEGTPSFEQSYAELQEIVAKLESGAATLEEALALYTRGRELGRFCAETLEQAELRVRELSPKPSGTDAAEG